MRVGRDDAAGAGASSLIRCSWATKQPVISYHDTEWGVPEHDDRMLFELLTLEGAQAGLSWETILKKRDGYRAAFAQFDPQAVAAFDARRRPMSKAFHSATLLVATPKNSPTSARVEPSSA